MIRNKAVTKLKLAEFYCLKVLEITGNFLEAIAFNAIFGEDYEPRTRDLMREKHLRLVIVGSMTLDCREGRSDPMSEAFLQMAGVFSQLELAMIRSRVRSGMANVKAKGKQIGRPQRTAESIPAIFLRHYPAYKNGQFNVSELARVCDLSRTTVYKYLSLLEG